MLAIAVMEASVSPFAHRDAFMVLVLPQMSATVSLDSTPFKQDGQVRTAPFVSRAATTATPMRPARVSTLLLPVDAMRDIPIAAPTAPEDFLAVQSAKIHVSMAFVLPLMFVNVTWGGQAQHAQ